MYRTKDADLPLYPINTKDPLRRTKPAKERAFNKGDRFMKETNRNSKAERVAGAGLVRTNADPLPDRS